MEMPDAASARDRLNNFVAVSVAIVSVFMAVTKVKDDNICQAMVQAKSDAVDTWNEYQAKRVKHHMVETARDQADALSIGVAPGAAERLHQQMQSYEKLAKKYAEEEPVLAAKAKGFEEAYDALNYHDDQFDLSDAALSIALGLMAVTALTQKKWLFIFAWVLAAVGMLIGVAGFCNLHIHPGALVKFLS